MRETAGRLSAGYYQPDPTTCPSRDSSRDLSRESSRDLSSETLSSRTSWLVKVAQKNERDLLTEITMDFGGQSFSWAHNLCCLFADDPFSVDDNVYCGSNLKGYFWNMAPFM